MEFKELVGLAALLTGIPLACAILLFWSRARDWVFFVLVAWTVFGHHTHINFLSREWYRGTTRGFEFTPLDILAVALLGALLLRPRRGRRRWYWLGGLLPMLTYAAYATLSLLFAEPKLFALFELNKLVRGIVVLVAAALYVQGERELKWFVWGLITAVWVEGIVALKMRYLGGVHRVFGSLDHPNSLSMFLCMCAPVLYCAAMSHWRRGLRWAALGGVTLASAGVILTISRMGVLALSVVLLGAVAACFSFRLSLRNLVMSGAVLGALVFGVAYAWTTLMSRYGEASLEDEYGTESLLGRGSYLRLGVMLANENLLGVGLNNWCWWVSNEYGPRFGIPYRPYESTSAPPDQTVPRGLDAAQAPPAHNLAALTAGELGWPGLVIFAAVWVRWLWMGASFLFRRSPDPVSRLGLGLFFALLAVILQSFTEWEYRQTPILFSVHLLMGTLAGVYWQRQRAARAAQVAAATR
jgi:hypothetical protein